MQKSVGLGEIYVFQELNDSIVSRAAEPYRFLSALYNLPMSWTDQIVRKDFFIASLPG